MVKTQIVVLA